ncbi:Polysaccharide lyase [Zobellia uliginosa]|uniref:Polysaccharide lyase n=2 Tax=Zobellia uliginosa TaxID=143224 RepID=A0ABY1KHP6_9FLAO|nr:Polysaccharide lyase [Zobellia uliginosa]
MVVRFGKLGLLTLCMVQFVSCSKDASLLQNKEQATPDTQTISVPKNTPCFTQGGFADDKGLKSWCWQDVNIPSYTGKKGVALSNGYLHVDSECYEKQVIIENDRIKFSVNPIYPAVNNWCSRDYNMRAEIRTAPWDVRHELGTEEWFGWSYTFGDNYIIDQNNQWKFFQVHNGVVGQSPQIGLEIVNANQFKGHQAGEIYVTVADESANYNPTGVLPKAGETINIVVHVVYGDAKIGLLQVWINDKPVFNKQVSTIVNSHPWGGNAKWGIYKWPWANSEGVDKSIQQGIERLDTYMGALRIVTRKPGDSDYLEDAYSLVDPN